MVRLLFRQNRRRFRFYSADCALGVNEGLKENQEVTDHKWMEPPHIIRDGTPRDFYSIPRSCKVKKNTYFILFIHAMLGVMLEIFAQVQEGAGSALFLLQTTDTPVMLGCYRVLRSWESIVLRGGVVTFATVTAKACHTSLVLGIGPRPRYK